MAGGCQQDFPSIAAAAEYGDRYKLGAAAKEQIFDIYRTYGGWINRYHGGITPLSVAGGMSWESRGNPLKFTPGTSIKEIGLMSVTQGVAENYDIDPFDPEANIWAGCRLRNERIRDILADEKFSWLVDADPYDWTELTGKLPGSLGFGGWKVLMGRAFPTPPPPGREQRIRPYDALRDWMLDHPGQVPKLGNMSPTLVACRVFRHHGVDFLVEVNQLHMPGSFSIIPRPGHLPRWSTSKFDLVTGTSASQRLARFPEYNRFPSSAKKSRGGLAVLVVGGTLVAGAGGYVLWRYLRG